MTHNFRCFFVKPISSREIPCSIQSSYRFELLSIMSLSSAVCQHSSHWAKQPMPSPMDMSCVRTYTHGLPQIPHAPDDGFSALSAFDSGVSCKYFISLLLFVNLCAHNTDGVVWCNGGVLIGNADEMRALQTVLITADETALHFDNVDFCFFHNGFI